MTMDTKTWILILIIVVGVIYFIYYRRKHQKEIDHLTHQGEPVADPLGNKPADLGLDDSVKEPEASVKEDQAVNLTGETVTIETTPATDHPTLTFKELLSQEKGAHGQLQGELVSFYTQDLQVEGAKALGSLLMDSQDSDQLVALKFLQEPKDLETNQSIRVKGYLQSIDSVQETQVPAFVVESVEKL